MKYWFWCALFFVFLGCFPQEEARPVTPPQIEEKLSEIEAQEGEPSEKNPQLEEFLEKVKAAFLANDVEKILSLSDPMQKGIQSEDFQIESCQYIIENFSFKNKIKESHCAFLSHIAQWEYDGYEVDEHFSYKVKGRATFKNGASQAFSFWVNKITDDIYLISGAVG